MAIAVKRSYRGGTSYSKDFPWDCTNMDWSTKSITIASGDDNTYRYMVCNVKSPKIVEGAILTFTCSIASNNPLATGQLEVSTDKSTWTRLTSFGYSSSTIYGIASLNDYVGQRIYVRVAVCKSSGYATTINLNNCGIFAPQKMGANDIILKGELNGKYTMSGTYTDYYLYNNPAKRVGYPNSKISGIDYDKFSAITFDYTNENASYPMYFQFKDGQSITSGSNTNRNTATLNVSHCKGDGDVTFTFTGSSRTRIFNAVGIPRTNLTDKEIMLLGEFNPKYNMIGEIRTEQTNIAYYITTANGFSITGIDFTDLTTLEIDCKNNQTGNIKLCAIIDGVDAYYSTAGNTRQTWRVPVSSYTGDNHTLQIGISGGSGTGFVYSIIGE